ncbi:MAG: hypothetical protein CME06_03915, partial [Gemmatimonadetes bacterium]|nr:hypothetical protein [Gemmatimonadota bacterium]
MVNLTVIPRILPALLLGLPLPAIALTSHSSPIAADETWIGGGEVHLIEAHIDVSAGATLTIESGAIVKFESGRYLRILDGTLLAQGSESDSIYFTSDRDDAIGGDTNGDGGATQPAPGNWSYIQLWDAPSSRIDYCSIRYGGSGNVGLVYSSASTFTGDAYQITNSSLAHSSTHGIYVGETASIDPLISGNRIFDIGATYYGIYSWSTVVDITIAQNTITSDRGILVRNDALVIGNTITDAVDWAIYLYSSGGLIRDNTTDGTTRYGLYARAAGITSGEITGNDFCGTGVFPVHIDAEDIRWLTSNTLTCPDVIGFEVIGGTVSTSGEWGPGGGRPYVVSGHITISAGDTITVLPGAIFKFPANVGVYVYGTLISAGTALNPITWTSHKDDSVGGDTNLDGDLTSPEQGEWYGIQLSGAPACTLSHNVVRSAGSISQGAVDLSYASFADPGPVVSDCTIDKSGNYGLRWTGNSSTDLSITDNVITEVANFGVYGNTVTPQAVVSGNDISAAKGIYVGGNQVISGNTIRDATTYAIQVWNAGPSIVNNTTIGATEYAVYVNSYTYTLNALTSNDFSGVGPFPLRLDASDIPSINGNTFNWSAARAFECLGGTLSEDLTWSQTFIPIVVLQSDVIVAEGATLTIAPGALVKWTTGQSLKLRISGSLRAVGTPLQPITFTSYRDDSIGGDTNGDDDTTLPQAGDWGRIQLDTADSCRIEYSNIRYGGSSGLGALYMNYTSHVEQAPLIKNCEFTETPNYGIYYQGAAIITMRIEDNLIRDIANYGIYGGSTSITADIKRNTIDADLGMYIWSASTIDQNTFVDARDKAIRLYESGAIVSSNAFTDSTGYAIFHDDGQFTIGAMIGNTFEGTGPFPLRIPAENVREIASNTLNWPDLRGIEVNGGTISTSATWPAGATLVNRSRDLTVPHGTTLTLAPGTVIKMDGSRKLDVEGTLISEGTFPLPITITDYRDDSVGGDTNGDGGTTSPTSSSWQRIELDDSEGSRLINTNLYYGGGGSVGIVYIVEDQGYVPAALIQQCNLAHSTNYGVYLGGSNTSAPTIAASGFSDLGDYAIYSAIVTQEPIITLNQIDAARGIYSNSDCVITDNTFLDATDWAIRTKFGAPTITGNNTLGETGYGIYAEKGDPYAAFGGNTFSGTGPFPVRLPAEMVRLLPSNTFTWTTPRGFKITGGTVTSDASWADIGIPYLLTTAVMTIDEAATLNFDAGLIMKFDPSMWIDVKGGLYLNGDAADPVVLTSIKDDAWGGDTNGDGGATSPGPGNWYYLYYGVATAHGHMEHARLLYGGQGSTAAMYGIDTDIPLTDSEFSHSGAYGIRLTRSAGAVTRCTMNDEAYGAYLASGGTATFTDCNLTGNTTYGVFNGSGSTISAIDCWWDSDTGPYHATDNPGGLGVPVDDDVDFTPWRGFPYTPDGIAVKLTSFQTIVPLGGTLDFREVLANTAVTPKTFDHQFLVYDGGGELFFSFPKTPVTLAAGEARTTIYTLTVPLVVPLDIYTLSANALDSLTVLDSDSLVAEVIDNSSPEASEPAGELAQVDVEQTPIDNKPGRRSVLGGV